MSFTFTVFFDIFIYTKTCTWYMVGENDQRQAAPKQIQGSPHIHRFFLPGGQGTIRLDGWKSFDVQSDLTDSMTPDRLLSHLANAGRYRYLHCTGEGSLARDTTCLRYVRFGFSGGIAYKDGSRLLLHHRYFLYAHVWLPPKNVRRQNFHPLDRQ